MRIQKIDGYKINKSTPINKTKVSFASFPLIAHADTPIAKYNNCYNTIAFGAKTEYTEGENAFRSFRKNFSRKLHKQQTKYYTADWNSFINSTPENMQQSSKEMSAFMDIVADKNDFEKLKQINANQIKDKKLKKDFDELMIGYAEKITHKEEIEALTNKTNEVQAITNKYRGEVDGKTYTNDELSDMLLKEQSPEMRKKLYDARKGKIGDILAPELINLAKKRNDLAKKLGFSDYFEYMMERAFKTKESVLFKLIDDMDKNTSELYKQIIEPSRKNLENVFGVQREKLQPWHYGLEPSDSPTLELDKCFKTNDDIVKPVFDLYKKMGWDIEKLPITLDLFPRANKNQHAYNFPIDTNKDTRVLMNIRPDDYSFETLMHELGHSVYQTGLSNHIPLMDQEPASDALTEAVAMMNEKLAVKESAYEKYFNVSKELSQRLKKDSIETSVSFMRFCMHLITFEKELYKNPDQDLAKLWYENEKKYLLKAMPEKLDNRWASERTHLVSSPVYYQNYFRAEIMAAHIYDAATAKLGPLTENENTAKFLKSKIFRFGKSLTDLEVIKHATGKELSTEAYLNQIKKIAHNIK